MCYGQERNSFELLTAKVSGGEGCISRPVHSQGERPRYPVTRIMVRKKFHPLTERELDLQCTWYS